VLKALRHTYPDLHVSAGGAVGFGDFVVAFAVGLADRVGVAFGLRLGEGLGEGVGEAAAITGTWPAAPMPAAPPSTGSGPEHEHEPVTMVSPAMAMAQSVLAARAICRSSGSAWWGVAVGVAADTLSDLHPVRS
jgi:hypothetical protein